MWILFAILTVLLWGTSETIFKKVSNADQNSVLKLIAYNGTILGVVGLVYMLFTKTQINLEIILTYLPNALIFIISMFCTYTAMKFTKVSITSPLQNASCAITTILCILILHQEVTILQAVAVVAILFALILVSFNKDESRDDKEEKRKLSRRIYLTGIGFALGYWLLDGIGSFMDDYVLTDRLSADQVFVSYGIIYMTIGIICFIALQIKNRVIQSKKGEVAEVTGKDKLPFDVYKLIGTLIETTGQFTYTYAYFYGDGALVSPFIASYCIITMILSRIFLKEKLTKYQYILIGIILVSLIILSIE